MNNLSYKTAIRRREMSAPVKFLYGSSLIKGKVLVFGSGYGKDAESLRVIGIDVWEYDPHFKPLDPKKNSPYDTILCTNVLNVIEEQDRITVIKNIASLLAKDGKAYITVRRDIKQPTWTRSRTFQDYVKLSLPIICENSKFCIYRLTKNL